jgi:hypothetical protein
LQNQTGKKNPSKTIAKLDKKHGKLAKQFTFTPGFRNSSTAMIVVINIGDDSLIFQERSFTKSNVNPIQANLTTWLLRRTVTEESKLKT